MPSNPAIVTNIQKVLNNLSSTPSERILLRVPNHLRRVNEKAYEPHVISIGPYHRGKDHLAAMEEHKFRYLNLLLRRRGESSIERYVDGLSRELYRRATDSYEKRILEKRGDDDFLETMLVDGCFIVELIRKGVTEDLSSEDDDPIFRSEMILYNVNHDLLLLENQLPFFILQKLFDMTLLPNEQRNHLVDMIFRFFVILPGPGYKRREEHNLPKVQVRHLLGLMHDSFLPSPQGVKAYLSKTEEDKGPCLSIDCDLICGKKENKEVDAETHIRCATELKEAGIKFKMAEEDSMLDIKFENGVLAIPKLTIEDRTESPLRNLIAYEQFWKGEGHIHQITDYTEFMDSLINSAKDVELLRRSGIIDNLLGNDEVVASMFNGLLDNVMVYTTSSFYTEIYVKVKKHCGREWNVWKAKLRHDYFNGPWALISFLAALFLLLLTVLQSVYSVLSYHSP